VDDGPHHHQVVEATLRGLKGFSFAGFHAGHDAVATFAKLASSATGRLPDVILMDFYLGHERGDAVTAELRRLEPPRARPVIVGYSSVSSGSERIVEAGGDLILPKICDPSGTNPQLRRFLEQLHLPGGVSHA
jgi:CheY-like chemotaxis protein